MTNARRDGLILVFLGSAVIVVILGYLLLARSPGAVHDFISSYYATRCLLHQSDPYSEKELLGDYEAEGAPRLVDETEDRISVGRYVYPPTTFAVLVPFALFPWDIAHILWAIFSASSLILAACLAFDLGADHAPILCGAIIAYLLANSEILVMLSNPSALMIALCVIAAWCFIRDRFVAAGILCMALSLAIKPQGPGLVWLYFLLAGGVFRKRALQVLVVACAISIPFMVWTWMVSPHWIRELQANIQSFSYRGGPTDPGPSSSMRAEFLDLQVVLSRFHDSPVFYNSVTYLVFAPLLLIWAAATVRTKPSKRKDFLALAAIAPLSLLPIYHHYYDTKLLLLVVPGLGLLWTRRNRVAFIALLLTAASFFFTGDLSHWLVTRTAQGLYPAPGGSAGWLADAVTVFPAPLLLLATGVFYLWIYVESSLIEERIASGTS